MNFEDFCAKATNFIAMKAKVQKEQIKPETHLVESGIVDSLLLTELILFVEDALNCTIQVDAFKLASFESINSIYSSYGHK
jgi:acyl carrier protein